MEYVVVKLQGDSDMIGKLALLDDKTITIEDPVYVSVRLSQVSGQLTLGMSRATLLADSEGHKLTLDLSAILSYYYPSEQVVKYYEQVVEKYVSTYDVKFNEILMETNNEQEIESETFSREVLEKLAEFLTVESITPTSNSTYH